jgi:hypothetical protein
MESLIKNNHFGLYNINHDYFLCRFHDKCFNIVLKRYYKNQTLFIAHSLPLVTLFRKNLTKANNSEVCVVF